MNSTAVPTAEGMAFVYTFPFWLFIKDSVQDAPDVKDIIISGTRIRLYPPFRSGPANFIPMPYVDPSKIPFLPGARPETAKDYKLISLSAIPGLVSKPGDKPSVHLVWGDTWKDKAPEPFPMDSIRIDVIGGQEIHYLAHTTLHRLLSILRCRSRQWWIGHSVHGLVGSLRNTFNITGTGAPVGIPEGATQAHTVYGNEQAIDHDLWQTTVRDLEAGVKPPLYDEVLLDGAYFASISDVRRSVFETANACEQAKEVTFVRLWSKKFPKIKYRRGKVLRDYNLPKHLDRSMKSFCPSYKEEHPDMFKTIEELWYSRGSVAHGGQAEYCRGDKTFVVDEKKAAEFVSVGLHCIRWLEAL